MATLNQLRVPLQQVLIKQGESKNTGKPYFFFEVFEPTRKFLQPDNPKVELLLVELVKSGSPVDLNVLFSSNGFTVDDSSFKKI